MLHMLQDNFLSVLEQGTEVHIADFLRPSITKRTVAIPR